MANSQLSAEHAVIFPELPGTSPLDYLQEIGAIIGSSQIHSFYNNEGFIKIYLKEKIHIEKISQSGIVVLGHHLQANNVESSLLRLTLSRVDPVVPDSYLEDLLKSYGTLVSPVTHRKIFEDASFSHIDSGVRHVDLKVCKGVCIPTAIQVQYKDILCAVDVKVEKESQLKKSVGVKSSRKSLIPNNNASTALDDSTSSDAKSSKESAFEFISQSAETVKINPRRSVKKISNCGEPARNIFRQGANGVISCASDNPEDLSITLNNECSQRNIDHLSQNEQYLSKSNAINICDLSLPKSAENRYTYLSGKQRLKSDRVLNELISQNFFPINKDSTPTAREQHSFKFGVSRNKRINVSRYPKIKSDRRNQKKSVISELLSIHRTERQVPKKVNSCVLNNLCDIQQVNPPNAIVWSKIKKKINERLKIGELASSASLVPNEVSNISTNKPVHLQKLNKRSLKSSKGKTGNKRLKSSSTNNVQCSSNSSLTRSLRPRSKTDKVYPNPEFTYEQNESSDTFIILPKTSENSKCPNSSSDGLRDFDNRPSSTGFVSQQNLPSCSKPFKMGKNLKSTLSTQDNSNNFVSTSSLTGKEKSQYRNLKDNPKHLNKKILDSKCQQKRSQPRFKKVETTLSRDVARSLISKSKSKTDTTYLKTVTSLEQSNKSSDTLPQASDGSKCLNSIYHSGEKKLGQANVKYGIQQKLSSSAKAFKTSKYQKLTPTQDVASNNAVPTSLTDREKSRYPKLNKNPVDFDKRSSGAKCRSQQKRSQYKLEKFKVNINQLHTQAIPQNIVGNDVPSSLLGNEKSQCPDLITSSISNKSKVLDKKPAKKQQTTSKGNSINRKRETWNSISAAAKNVTCPDDVSSFVSKKNKSQDSDLNANLSKEELSSFEKMPSDTLHINQKVNSTSSSKPGVTSIMQNSEPASFEVQSDFFSSKEKSECSAKTMNLPPDKSNDFNETPSDSQSKSQQNKLSANSKNKEIGVNLDSLSDLVNVVDSDEESNLSSNKEKSPYTDSKVFSKVLSDITSIKQPENLQLSTKNNEIKHGTNLNYTLDFVQDTTSCNASTISLSNEQITQALDQNNEESNDFNKEPTNMQCKRQQDNIQNNPKEVNIDANLDSQPELVLNGVCSDEGANLLLNNEEINRLSIGVSKDSNEVPSDTQNIEQPDSLQFTPNNDKTYPETNLSLTSDPSLDKANCDADTLSDSPNKEISGTFDLNASSSNNTSKDVDQSQSAPVNQEMSLQYSTEDNLSIISNSTAVLKQNLECFNAVSGVPSSIKESTDLTAELNDDKSVDITKEKLDAQRSISLDKTLPTNSIFDKTLNLNPVAAQNMETSDISPSLFPSNKIPQSQFEKNSSIDCKSTDYDVGQSNPQCENLKPSAIVTETIKPPKIGICLPIPQCPTNSSGFRSLNFNQELAYKQCINSQKIPNLNNRKDLTNMKLNSTSVFPQNVQVTTNIENDKVYQGPNSTYCISNSSDSHVKKCHSNNQSKSSFKKSGYGISSIFYNSKTNNNRNKNTKVVKKRKMKSKAKSPKVNVTSDANLVQNKGCFSEYEFNSSDSDSKDISYSKWRSQKQTPKKRFRSSSLDNVSSTGFPPSLENNSTNILPYDLSMKSRKLSPTIVNSARYDYNTLIRKKRERLDAICRRVSLINKGNLSNKPLLISEKGKTVENVSNHALSVSTCAMNKKNTETQNTESQSKGLNTSNSLLIPEVISNSVLPLNIPRVDCNFNLTNLNSTSLTIVERNKEAIHYRQQVFESKDSVQIRNSSNYKSTMKSLQHKDFKKSLSQIHAKKVRKRMKKNTVRYMCLQNDGKKIVLKKVGAASDSNKNPIDLTNRIPDPASLVKETSSSFSNELENDKESNAVEVAATVKDNSLTHQPTGNTEFNSCVNGFLQQLASSNQPNDDAVDFSEKRVKENTPLNLVNKTVVEHMIDNNIHFNTTTNENVDLVDKDVSDPQSTAGVNVEGFQPSISCSPSNSFPENTEVVKDVELPQSQMPESNEKYSDAAAKNITSESNCPSDKVLDGVIVKLEPADPESCDDGDAEDVQENRRKQIAVGAPCLNLHLDDAQTPVNDDVITSIKITEVFGSTTLNPIFCEQIEKGSGSENSIIPENRNMISNAECMPVCLNDNSNENLMIRSGTSATSEITIQQLFSNSAPINGDSPVQRASGDVNLTEKYKQLHNNKTNNENCVHDTAFEQNGANAEGSLNQSTIVSSHAIKEKRVILIKCEKDQQSNMNCVSKAPCAVAATSNNEVRKSYQQDSENGSASINNDSGNHQIVPATIKREKNETLSSEKVLNEQATASDNSHQEFPVVSNQGLSQSVPSQSSANLGAAKISSSSEKELNGQTSISDGSCHEFPEVSNQRLSQSASLKSTANSGVTKIMRSPGGSVKVKKEKESPTKAKGTVSTPAKFHTTMLSNCVKNKTTSLMKPTQQHSKSYKLVSEKERTTSSANDVRKGLCTTAAASVNKERKLDPKDNSESRTNQELSNSEGHYMIEKTEKPNTFRIFRQTSISSENAPSPLLNPINQKVGQPSTERVSNDLQQALVINDNEWGPYLAVAKDRSKVCEKRLKRRRSSNKELSPKKKCLNSCLLVDNVNSDEIISVDINTIVPAENRPGTSSQSSSNEANRFDTSASIHQVEADSSKILLISNDDRNCDIDHFKNSAYASSTSTTSTSGESNTKPPSVDSPSDNFTLPCDKAVVVESVEVMPKDIYSIYRNISQDCKNTVRSVINFPLSEQRLNKFLHEARGHSNPRKLALNVLQNNKTPGALKELIVQLYDYFKVCNDRKKQLRVSRLIMLLDNRNK